MAKVYIDAGHGGSDNGAVKYLNERDINLVMALACRDYLNSKGVTTKMSRTRNDVEMSLNHTCNECNAWGADLAISIHNNAGGGDGFEVIHSIGSSKGITMSKNIEAEVKAIGQNSRGLKTRKNANGKDYFGFNRLINCPSIICEGLFVDNATDVQIGNTVAKQQAFGIAYAKGILKTLGMSTDGGSVSSSTPASSSSSNSGSSSTSNWIANLQSECNKQGYSNQAVDGVAGKNTLAGCPLMKQGVSGNITKILQSRLISLGYSCGSAGADGIFGSGTKSAVKNFQSGHGLVVDGIVGTNTWRKLLGL